MKKMLTIGLVTALGIAGLVISAFGQTQGNGQTNPFDPVLSPPAQNTQGDLNSLYSRGFLSGQYLYQPGGETEKLARQLAKAKTDAEREGLRSKLNDLLEKQFDERQKKHKAESEALEAQVKKLKELIATRNENRREIISRRLEQIVRDAQGLGW
jgi:hypothetical protein